MQPWALVSPSSRGIGLELARRLLQTTTLPVVATARTNLDETRDKVLSGLDNVTQDRLRVIKLDVLGKAFQNARTRLERALIPPDEKSVASAAKQLSDAFPSKQSYLHLSLCIPGLLFPEKSPGQIDYENALLTFRTNTLGPMLLMKHFSPFLPRKATAVQKIEGLPDRAVWAMMSARVGSISDNRLGGWYSYRASKAAVNQLNRSFDNYLRTSSGDNAISISLHPGTVKTDLSKEFWSNVREDKLFSTEYASQKLMEVINSRKIDDRGKCWDWAGEEIPP